MAVSRGGSTGRSRWFFALLTAGIAAWGCNEAPGPTGLPDPGAAQGAPGSGKVSSAVPEHRVLVRFVETPQPAVVETLGGQVDYVYHLVPAVAARVPEENIEALRVHPAVERIEPDVEVRAAYSELDSSWGVQRIGAGVVQASGNLGQGIKIGVLDTGIRYDHPDLDANYAGGYDFANRDPDPYDDNGHGTAVAGIIAAEKNGFGIVGVAPKARLYALKVLKSDGTGVSSDVIAALEWCVDHGIQVTNHSYAVNTLELVQTLTVLSDAFDQSAQRGVLHVAAAGNSGNVLGVGDNVVYPARYSSVIAVGATDRSNQRASFSSTGPDVELAAPGVDVPTTVNWGNGYGGGSGTSLAAPHVTGTAALVLAAGIADANRNGRVNDEVEARLQQTADDLGLPGRDPEYGYGLVDAARAAH